MIQQQYRGYTVTSSIEDGDIFLKIKEPDRLTEYEAIVHAKDLGLQNDAVAIYKLITDTFDDNNTNFRVVVSVENGWMTIAFHALVGYFSDVYVHFVIGLQQKLSN